MNEHAHSHLTEGEMVVRVRLGHVLFRHTRPEDMMLSDHDLVMAVMKRYQQSREEYLTDPSE